MSAHQHLTCILPEVLYILTGSPSKNDITQLLLNIRPDSKFYENLPSPTLMKLFSAISNSQQTKSTTRCDWCMYCPLILLKRCTTALLHHQVNGLLSVMASSCFLEPKRIFVCCIMGNTLKQKATIQGTLFYYLNYPGLLRNY